MEAGFRKYFGRLRLSGSPVNALDKRLYISQPPLSLAQFLSTGLLVNVLQAILFITVRPFSLRQFRVINQHLVTINWSLFVFLADWWASLKLRLYGTKECWGMHND
jgi:hypothetical protein